MEKIILELRNPEKRDLLMALLAELDFVKVRFKNEKVNLNEKKTNSSHSIFSSVGIWENADISQASIRSLAWKR